MSASASSSVLGRPSFGVEPYQSAPWQTDVVERSGARPAPGKNYSVILLDPASDPEADLVRRCFNAHPPVNTCIRAVYFIHNESRETAFEEEVHRMENKGSPSFPKDADSSIKTLRERAKERFENIERNSASQERRLARRHVHELLVWHGTATNNIGRICSEGLDYRGPRLDGGLAAGSTDEGYFGAGVYTALEAAYAIKYPPRPSWRDDLDQRTLFLSWAVFRDPLPIVSDVPGSGPGKPLPSDMRSLKGKPLSDTYDAHFIPVRSILPVDSENNVDYYPCAAGEDPCYHEFVFKSGTQALVRYRVDVGPLPAPSRSLVEDVLIHARLAIKSLTLSPAARVALLSHWLMYGREQAERARGQNLVFFMGPTGAGKSTLINYLAGCHMIGQTTPLGKTVYVVDPASPQPEVMKIGQSSSSETLMPQIATLGGITYCDCPGFEDNRGSEMKIAHAVNIRLAVEQASQLRFVILIDSDTLSSKSADGLPKLLNALIALFGDPQALIRNKNSLWIGMSKVEKSLDIATLRKGIVAQVSSDLTPLMQELQDRVFMFDLGGALPAVSDRWDRAKILEEIGHLSSLSSGRGLFREALTEGDRDVLRTIVDQMGKCIEQALGKREYARVVEHLDHLRKLRDIDHFLVGALLSGQDKKVEEHFARRGEEIKNKCMSKEFDVADSLLRGMRDALGLFNPKPACDERALQAFYDERYQEHKRDQEDRERRLALIADKAADAQQRCGALEVQLGCYEAEKEALKNRIKELETQNSKQEQDIEKLTRRYSEEFARLKGSDAERTELTRRYQEDLKTAEQTRRELLLEFDAFTVTATGREKELREEIEGLRKEQERLKIRVGEIAGVKGEEWENTFGVFGAAMWRKYFGEVENIPPPENIEALLNESCPIYRDSGLRVRDTHLLVLIPRTVNGTPFTLNALNALVQAPRRGTPTKIDVGGGWDKALAEHGPKPSLASHWVLMTRRAVPNSTHKSYSDQCALVEGLGSSYEVPHLLDAVTCVLLERVRTGAFLYGERPWVRVQEQTRGWRLIFGAFAASGLRVDISVDDDDDDGVGVSGLRKF